VLVGNATNACAIQKFSVCLLTAGQIIQDRVVRKVDNAIQSSNNWGQNYLQLKPLFPCWGIGYDDDDDEDDNDDDWHFP